MKAFHNDPKVKERYIPHSLAKKSVMIAKIYFESIGYEVSKPKHPCTNGPDLCVGEFRVEVKKVFYSSRAYKVSKVTRTADDYIAIIFNDGHVHVERMEDHLRLCSKDGGRCVTGLARLYGRL